MRFITDHCAIRLMERGGISAAKVERLLKGRKLPDGEFPVPGMLGTVIIRGGRMITFLAPEMSVIKSAR